MHNTSSFRKLLSKANHKTITDIRRESTTRTPLPKINKDISRNWDTANFKATTPSGNTFPTYYKSEDSNHETDCLIDRTRRRNAYFLAM